MPPKTTMCPTSSLKLATALSCGLSAITFCKISPPVLIWNTHHKHFSSGRVPKSNLSCTDPNTRPAVQVFFWDCCLKNCCCCCCCCCCWDLILVRLDFNLYGFGFYACGTGSGKSNFSTQSKELFFSLKKVKMNIWVNF